MNPSTYDHQRQTIELPEGEISYVKVGVGAPVLFVHGLMLNNAVWRPLIGYMQTERTCYAPDLLGHGRSLVPKNQNLSLDAQAQMIENFCLKMGFERVDLVANDFGGAVASVFAANNPDLIRTITFTNCDTHYNLGPPADIRQAKKVAEAGKLGNAVANMLDNVDYARAGFPGRGFEDPANLTQELVEELLGPAFSTEVGQNQFEHFILALDEKELAAHTPKLSSLSAPALLVWGTEDSYFGLPWAFWLRDTLKGQVSLVEIEGGRLFVQLERTEEVATAIRVFWKENCSAHQP
ncbi:haloalkane dehalogenase 2 [Rhodobiaceae bacterium]|nr:haloalkane dehalogenase 2 [Rhodobiaceae bacterium]